MVRNLSVAILAVPVAVIVMSGCAVKGAELPGAVYAQSVSVYKPATYTGAMGGESSEDIGGPPSSESVSWFFETTDPMDQVVAFYDQKLTGATKGSSEDGRVQYTFVPQGAEEGEEVQVLVGPGTIQIHES